MSNNIHLNFTNRYLKTFPADLQSSNTIRQVENACYSFVAPQKTIEPNLIKHTKEVAQLIDLKQKDTGTKSFLVIFSGNEPPTNTQPYATCYGGHQFGHWAGQLGDGRAIMLGEVINQKGEHYYLQLKGAGPTPYSRHADGLAVLRSSVREFLCSEAIHHLGIPTTRALSLIGTGEKVVRDMFYDGHPKAEPGAIVCRVAQSFTRFGSFEIHAARGEHDILKKLIDYTITTDFPHLGRPSQETYQKWFHEICTSTAHLIVEWSRVGFVHGVMNTDNMSILGLTIDYGPYGWLDEYNPSWTPNTTDAEGRRYAFGNQANIGHWNLAQLANALSPIITDTESLKHGLELYAKKVEQEWHTMMAHKLGLLHFESKTDDSLIADLLQALQTAEIDYTLFFRRLAKVDLKEVGLQKQFAPLQDAFYSPSSSKEQSLSQWLQQYIKRAKKDKTSSKARQKAMNAINPKYILRNYLVQQAIDKAEQGDYSEIDNLLELSRHPYDEQPDKEIYAQKRPDWAKNKAGCSMLSCSS